MEHFSFRRFQRAILRLRGPEFPAEGRVAYQSAAGDLIDVTFTESGTFKEPQVDWGYGPLERHVTITAPTYQQPEWPTGLGYGRIPYLVVNHEVLNLKERWPVFNGPHLTLRNKVLEFRYGDQFYQVDYRGPLPVFESPR